MALTNDEQMVAACTRLDELVSEIDDVISKLSDSDAPALKRLADALYEKIWVAADPRRVCMGHLEKKSEWKIVAGGKIEAAF